MSLQELLNAGLLQERQKLYDKNKNFICYLLDNDRVTDGQDELSIHKMAAKHLNKSNHNGWSYFYVEQGQRLVSIDSFRYEYERAQNAN